METHPKKKKLLLVGATIGSVHIKNYYNLISDYFDDILIVTNGNIDFCDFEIIDFSLKNPLGIRKNVLRLRQIIKSFQPDLIHVHQANSVAYIAIRANQKRVPLVLTTWGSDVLLLPKKGLLFKKLVKYSLSRADVITADANFMATSILNLGINKEIIIANFGIDFDSINFSERKNIIYSNRLHNDLYSIDKIIDAFAKFVIEFPEWKLIIGANGKNTDALKEQAKNKLPQGSFEFIGFVSSEENKRHYLNSKIWISVPTSDGTAISLLEAMAFGCIPVVSDLPANREWIIDAKNGCIVQSNICNSLKIALSLPLKVVQELNGEIIRARATKKVNKIIFESAYNDLLA